MAFGNRLISTAVSGGLDPCEYGVNENSAYRGSYSFGNLKGFGISDDGHYVYTKGNSNTTTIQVYYLSTANDMSAFTHVASITAGLNGDKGCAIGGTKLYQITSSGNTLKQYELTSPTTAVLVNVKALAGAAEDIDVIDISPDGSHFSGSSGNYKYFAEMSTPYDITTIGTVSQVYATNLGRGITYSIDGSKVTTLRTGGSTGSADSAGYLDTFELSTPYNLYTRSLLYSYSIGNLNLQQTNTIRGGMTFTDPYHLYFYDSTNQVVMAHRTCPIQHP